MSADFTLPNGREILINEHVITHKEYMLIMGREATDDQIAEILSKALGVTPDEIGDFPETYLRSAIMRLLERINNAHPF